MSEAQNFVRESCHLYNGRKEGITKRILGKLVVRMCGGRKWPRIVSSGGL